MPNLLDSYFLQTNLTTSLNDMAVPDEPRIQRVLSSVIDENGITTTKGFIERQGETVDLVPAAPRGGVGQPLRTSKRDGVEVAAVHIPQRDTVYADVVQDVRAFGTPDSTYSVDQIVRQRLAAMKKNMEYTKAFHLLGALKGQVLDVDGSLILDAYALWGVSQQEVSMGLNSATTKLARKAVDVQRRSEDAMGGAQPPGYIGLASPSFMDAIREHANFDDAVRYAEPSKLLKDYRSGIQLGDIAFVEIRAPEGWPVRIEDGTAYVVPDVPGMFIRRYAPADYTDTVNTLGIPYYVRSEPLPMGKGYTMEAQTNVFTLPRRPRALIKCTA